MRLVSDVINERQAEVTHALEEAQRYVGNHPEQIAEREWREQRAKEFVALALRGRAAEEATRRNLDFAVPEVPGKGWATTEFKTRLLQLSMESAEYFAKIFELEERVAEMKKQLGVAARGTSVLVNAYGLVEDMESTRKDAIVAEATFEQTFEMFKRECARLADAAFIAKIEELNATADEAFFAQYIMRGSAELEAIAAAAQLYMDAVAGIVAAQENAMAANAQGVALAREIGVAPPSAMHRISMMYGEALAQESAENAVSAWRRNGHVGPAFEPDRWFPSWRR